jgi:hypothetical protein
MTVPEAITMANRIRLTAGRGAELVPSGKPQAFLWGTEAPSLLLRAKGIAPVALACELPETNHRQAPRLPNLHLEWTRSLQGIDANDSLTYFVAAGDSMSPEVEQGDIVLVDLRVKGCGSRGTFVFDVAGAPVIRRVEPQIDGGVCVAASNVMYPAMVLAADPMLGKAVAVVKVCKI